LQLFYIPNIKSDILPKDEFIHCIKVLRHKVKDVINVTDGKGNIYSAKIVDISKNKCTIQVISSIKKVLRKKNIHLVIAPTKSFNKMEWMIEKLTEIGISEVSFVYSKNSERKKINLNRLEKKSISAMKQSNSALKPVINEIISFEDFLNKNLKYKEKFIAHIEAKKLLKDYIKYGDESIIIIGPEGDFSKEEIDLAKIHKFKDISLGKNILRTETAGLISCYTIINY
jgi:16S rRNA (uracil1498-N3)-methyltransferase